MKIIKRNIAFEFPIVLEQKNCETNPDFCERVDNLVSVLREKLNERDEEKLAYCFRQEGPFIEMGNYSIIYFQNQIKEVDKLDSTLRKKIIKKQKEAMVDYYKECKETLVCSKQTKKNKKSKTKK